ncbi:uncharacterized protein LOC114119438 isoform X1 [Aphis gossypii]|uniref:uncharacterized protein LOC114119438 isoform X1 n=2 Tax=Aphis gossypii TaxID=80765 RepID=UPI00100F4F81|nr:uncharacterized protein LOC114119438 isoform X1 [Aphis gossypii]
MNKLNTIIMNNDQCDDVVMQEEVTKQRMLAQKKEKKIKIIRILTVIAYLVSVSTVATMLSAYYIFVWNPQTGNITQTPNAERLVTALKRASSEYVFAKSAGNEYTDNGRFITEVKNSYKTNDQIKNPQRSIQFQTSTIKSSTSRIQTPIGNISESIIVAKNLS